MTGQVLTLNNISKRYGKIQALDGVSFSVPAGTVFGILGPNGSGKTTLLGIIMDILKHDSGSFSLFNEMPSAAHRSRIGTLLETPNFYHYLSATRNLRISAAIKGRGEDDIDRVLDVVDLTRRKDSAFSTYSLGMKQRLAIGAALLGDPEVLVFDEPTNGLDPVGIADIRNLIKSLSKQGKTIIMASHLLDEVEKVCTHVAIMKKGKVMASGSVKEIFAKEDTVQLHAADMDKLRTVIKDLPGQSSVYESDGLLEVSFPSTEQGPDLAAINQYCFSHGVILDRLLEKHTSLEKHFMELTNA